MVTPEDLAELRKRTEGFSAQGEAESARRDTLG